MSSASLPSWLPTSACEVEQDAKQETLRNLQRCPVRVPLLQRSIQTVFLKTTPAAAGSGKCTRSAL